MALSSPAGSGETVNSELSPLSFWVAPKHGQAVLPPAAMARRSDERSSGMKLQDVHIIKIS